MDGSTCQFIRAWLLLDSKCSGLFLIASSASSGRRNGCVRWPARSECDMLDILVNSDSNDKPWEDCTFSEPSFEGSESHGRCESYSPDGDGPCWSVSNFFTQWYACDFKNSKVKSEWFWNINNYMFHNSSHQILELGVHDAKKKWVLLLLVKKMCSTKAMRMAGCSKWLNIN